MASFSTLLNEGLQRDVSKLGDEISKMEKQLKKAKINANQQSESKSHFSCSYGKWDDFNDTEELEKNIKEYKAKLKSLKEKSAVYCGNINEKQCSHGINCGCLGNKKAERDVMAMSTSERIRSMNSFKNEGNILFGKDQFERALALYEKSLIFYEYCFDGNASERKSAEKLRLQCLLNSAACFLHLNRYRKCIEQCDEALEIDCNNKKALFRRARAHRFMDKFDLAEKDLMKIIETRREKVSMEVENEIELISSRRQDYETSLICFAKKAFSGNSRNENTEDQSH